MAGRPDQAPTVRGILFTQLGKSPVSGIAIANDGVGPRNTTMLVPAAFADPAPAPSTLAIADNAFILLREA